MRFTNPLEGIEYEQAWGPWAGTHRRGQNWQSGSAWDLLHADEMLPVRAPFAGTVVSAAVSGGVGRFAGAKVGIQGAELSCFLTHLSSLLVSRGASVNPGECVGCTGQANGVWHLHVALGGPDYFDMSDANGIDPKPFLEGSATLIAERGPKGFPLWHGNTSEAASLPHGNTLRLSLNGQTYAGWEAVAPRLRWIARHGLTPGSEAALAWRGNVWRGAKDVTNVARNLTDRYLEGP